MVWVAAVLADDEGRLELVHHGCQQGFDAVPPGFIPGMRCEGHINYGAFTVALTAIRDQAGSRHGKSCGGGAEAEVQAGCATAASKAGHAAAGAATATASSSSAAAAAAAATSSEGSSSEGSSSEGASEGGRTTA